MNRMMGLTKMMGWFLTLVASIVATANIGRLIPTNPEYHASWVKVAVCIALIIWGWAIVRYSKE